MNSKRNLRKNRSLGEKRDRWNGVDHPNGKPLFEHVQDTYSICINEPEYWIAELGNEYRMMYSRMSGMVQCYYQGYGHDTEQEWIGKFDSPEEILAFVESHRGMDTNKTKAVEETSRKNGALPKRITATK